MIINKIELSKKIRQLKQIAPTKAVVEATKGVLYEAGCFIACNTEVAVKAKIKGLEDCTDEPFIIPDKVFDFINNLPNGDVRMECKDNILSIQIDKIKNKFTTFPVSSFVKFRENLGDEGMIVDTDDFKQMVSHVLFSVANNSANKIMSGMYLHSEGDYLNFVGLDGHKVAWDKLRINSEYPIDMIVPKLSLEKMMKLDISGDMTIVHDNIGAKFITEEYEIYTRLISGKYFGYKNLFNPGTVRTILFKDKIIDAVNRAKSCGTMESKKPVIFNCNSNCIELSYRSEFSDYRETIDLLKDFTEELQIGFNPALLLESLKAFDSEVISMAFNTKKTPVIIKADDSDMTVLVLPVNF